MSMFVEEFSVHEMDKHMKEHLKKGLKYILMLFLSPIAILLLIFISLLSLLRFFLKATLLFSIVAINTPFAMMINSSILVINYLNDSNDSSFDPRVSVGIEFKAIVSDFFKVIAAEILLIMSTGVITFYTAPRRVFYISIAGGVIATILKWLNTNSLSKTAVSCLCGGFGLNPIMFFFSFIGLFDIGCHPVAKCSFPALKAFLFTKEDPSQHNAGKNPMPDSENLSIVNPSIIQIIKFRKTPMPDSKNSSTVSNIIQSIEFSKWNAFERGLFQLRARIDFIKRDSGKYILESFMVLRLREKFLCEYHVERLELPEDYSKAIELYNFLDDLSSQDGFVTNKMRGRYEHSLTLLEIVDGVEESIGYKIMDPMDERFIVVGCIDLLH